MTKSAVIMIPASNGQPAVSVNVRVSETHIRRAEVARQVLESGAPVTDHVILTPRTLSVNYVQPNATSGGADAAQAAYDALEAAWTRRQPLTVLTQNAAMANMVIETLTIVHQAPNKGALDFTANFVQINYATMAYIKVPASRLDPSVKQTASSQVTGGTIQPVKLWLPYPFNNPPFGTLKTAATYEDSGGQETARPSFLPAGGTP